MYTKVCSIPSSPQAYTKALRACLVAANVGNTVDDAGTAGEVACSLHPGKRKRGINRGGIVALGEVALLGNAEELRAWLHVDVVVRSGDERRVSRAVVDKRIADAVGSGLVVDVRDGAAEDRPVVDDNAVRNAAAIHDYTCSIPETVL